MGGFGPRSDNDSDNNSDNDSDMNSEEDYDYEEYYEYRNRIHYYPPDSLIDDDPDMPIIRSKFLKCTLSLYLNPNFHLLQQGKGYQYKVTIGFWDSIRKVIACFLSNQVIPGTVREIITPPLSLRVSEDERMIPSKPHAGSHADVGSTIGDIFTGILRECYRLGRRPFGMAPDDNLAYPKFTPSSKIQDFKNEKNIQFARFNSVKSSLSDLLVDLENLGHPTGIERVPALNVELRHYQKQALTWAVEQERQPERGLLRSISAELYSSTGTPTGVWFSPFSGWLTKEKPIDVRGGFIATEMGMGKTIITLGLIFANPPP